MSLSRHALTDLAAVKVFLRLSPDDTEYDLLLERQINAVSEIIERYCNRHFEKADYLEMYRGNGKLEILLNNYPVVEVREVTVNGLVLTRDDYGLTKKAGLYRDVGWLDDGKYCIEVDYTAGYVLPKDETANLERTLPYDLEDACIEMVAAKFNLRQEEAAGKKIRQVNEVGYTNYEKDVPDHIRRVLDQYKKVVV